MKYIKKFESLEDRYSKNQELKDFCEGSLVWLLDDGFEFSIIKISGGKELIRLIKRKNDDSFTQSDDFRRSYDKFENWKLSEIADHFIPFLQKLSSKYDVKCIVITDDMNKYIGIPKLNAGVGPEVSVEDFLSDRLNDTVFKGISVVLSEK